MTDSLGMLVGLALVILGIALLLFWIIGTWMNSYPVLAAGVACMGVGVYVAGYFGR